MIVFTICSNNYLPMARVWAESVLRHNPHISVVIGLVDLPEPTIDYRSLAPFELLPVRDIGIPNFDDMVSRYSILELNTAVKPFYFRYLFQRHANRKDVKVCYFDPDTKVYSNLNYLEDALEISGVLLTPHILTPVPSDGGEFGEHLFLNFGLYNLGFCGMRWTPATEQLLLWWSNHLVEQCKDDVNNGVFLDQLWMNYAPLFFKDVEVTKNPGLNVSYWNLHERHLQLQNGTWYVNGQLPLVFYHFSSFQIDDVESLGKYSYRYSMRNRPEMKPLFDEYRRQLLEYEFRRFRKIPCAYIQQRVDRKRDYYIKRPHRLLLDYRKHPFRLLTILAKAAVPQRVKRFVSRLLNFRSI